MQLPLLQSMGRHVSDYASALVSPPQVPMAHGHRDSTAGSAVQSNNLTGPNVAATGTAVPGTFLSTTQQEADHATPVSLAPAESSSPNPSEPAPTADSIRQGILKASHWVPPNLPVHYRAAAAEAIHHSKPCRLHSTSLRTVHYTIESCTSSGRCIN